MGTERDYVVGNNTNKHTNTNKHLKAKLQQNKIKKLKIIKDNIKFNNLTI